MLLKEGLKKMGLKENILSEIKYDRYLRPFIEENIDFNLSHSGNYVICALARDIKLGVDIERVSEIDFNDFTQTMNTQQWNVILQSPCPLYTFFRYWTIKESVVKAIGKGLQIPLKQIKVRSGLAEYGIEKWFLTKLYIDEKYPCTLATSSPNVNIKLNFIDFYKIQKLERSEVKP